MDEFVRWPTADPHVKHLKISSFEFSNLDGRELNRYLVENVDLQSVIIRDCFHPESDKFGQVLAKLSLKVLTICGFAGLNGTENAMISFAKSLTSNTSLKRLELAECIHSETPLKELVQSLYYNQSLEYFSLETEMSEFTSLMYLGVVLVVNKSLKTLILKQDPDIADESSLGQYSEEYQRGLKGIFKGLALNNTLQALHLPFMELDFEQGAELGIVLCVNNTLTELNLANNQIGSGILYIFKALTTNKSLRILDLDNNRFHSDDDEVVASFTEGLRANSTLQKLNILTNDVMHESIYLALIDNRGLTNIKFQYNPKDVCHLAQLIAKTSCLKSLKLYGHNLGSMIKIGEALSTNSTLTKLDLSVLFNIADPYYLEIFKCFEANQTLTSLKIGNRMKSELLSAQIYEILSNNYFLLHLDLPFAEPYSDLIADILKRNREILVHSRFIRAKPIMTNKQ